jgi:hypothetical protein
MHTSDDMLSMLQVSELIQVWESAAILGHVNVPLCCLRDLVNLHTTHDSLCKPSHQQNMQCTGRVRCILIHSRTPLV